MRRWGIRGGALPLDRTLVMGILNATPDSFSDGGQFADADAAIAAGLAQAEAGADLVDVGGESTRPGADPVPAAEELRRVLPIVEGLAARGVVVSVDTTKAAVAEAALDAGAHVVNDVSALSDPAMAEVVARHQAGLVVMHMRGNPRTMQDEPTYTDVVGEVRDHLVAAADEAMAAGLPAGNIAIDPGIGFGKTLEHNLRLLAATDLLAATGYPVVVGASRKAFLGALLGRPDPADRDFGTAIVTAFTVARGARVARVHNVPQILEVRKVVDAIVGAERESER